MGTDVDALDVMCVATFIRHWCGRPSRASRIGRFIYKWQEKEAPNGGENEGMAHRGKFYSDKRKENEKVTEVDESILPSTQNTPACLASVLALSQQ